MRGQSLKLLAYSSKISQCGLLPHFIDSAPKGDILKAAIINFKTKELCNLLSETCFSEEIWMRKNMRHKKDLYFKKIIKNIKDKYTDDAKEYVPILANQALVNVHSIFESFLAHCLEVITSNKPKLIKNLVDEKDINPREVIDAKTYINVFELIQSRILSRFNWKSLSGKIDTFDKMGLDINWVFDKMKCSSLFKERGDSPYDFLITIDKMRHEIIHDDHLPLKSLEPLKRISNFFSGLILAFGYMIHRDFKIPTDLFD